MKILLDTNVVLDILLDRKPFIIDSYGALKKALEEGHILYISASAATDIFYIVRKATKSKTQTIQHMKTLAKIMNFAKVEEDDILNALSSEIQDFEDAVVDSVAKSMQADLILTRNDKDFKNAGVKVITPANFYKNIK
ncbi:MAG: PIN domain-containing protein [Faecalicoccus sp.]|nr:PIN domain-containing protein [Faecalicoccus sp.]